MARHEGGLCGLSTHVLSWLLLPEPANPIPLMISANLSTRRNKRKLGVAIPRSFWSIRDTSQGFFDKQMMEDWERKPPNWCASGSGCGLGLLGRETPTSDLGFGF